MERNALRLLLAELGPIHGRLLFDPDLTMGLLEKRTIAGSNCNAVAARSALCERPGMSDHLTTSSARSSNDCGIVRPSALAVLRLITRSNFVGCSTGKSPGLAPLTILST